MGYASKKAAMLEELLQKAEKNEPWVLDAAQTARLEADMRLQFGVSVGASLQAIDDLQLTGRLRISDGKKEASK